MKYYLPIIILLFLYTQCFSANLLIKETFNAQTINADINVYGRYDTDHYELLVPPQYNLTSVGRDGTFYCWSSGTENGAWLKWETNLPSSFSSNILYASFWMRYPDFTSTDTHENIKFFYLHWNGAGSYVHYSYSHDDVFYYSAKGNGVMLDSNVWETAEGQTDGDWHHYEFSINFSTGSSKFWYDGNLIIDKQYDSSGWESGTLTYIAMPSIDAEEVGTFSRQIDDFEIWDGDPRHSSIGGNSQFTLGGNSTIIFK